jgi:hypothetical protein
MDLNAILVTAAAIGTGLGGFVGGRWTARSAMSDIAADTIEMLQTQNELLRSEKDTLGLTLLDLQTRVSVLEELVTQRADVEDLSHKVSLVKDTVERIAERVGA